MPGSEQHQQENVRIYEKQQGSLIYLSNKWQESDLSYTKWKKYEWVINKPTHVKMHMKGKYSTIEQFERQTF